MALQLPRFARSMFDRKSRHQVPDRTIGGLPHSFLMRLVIGGTTLAVSFAAYFSYQGARDLMLQNLKDKALLTVHQGADEIDAWLGLHRTSLEASANNPTFRTMDWSKIAPYLQAEEQRLPEFLYFGMIDQQGFLYTTLATQPNGSVNLKDRPHVQAALAGKSSLSNPLIARVPKGARVVAHAIPVWSGKPEPDRPLGRVVGLLNGVISVDRVVEVVNGLQYGKGSYAFALNSQGEVIVHPNSQLMSTLEKPAASLTDSTDRELAAIAQRMVAKSTGIELVKLDGVEKYVAFLPLQEANWSVALVIPRENIESQLSQLDLVALTVAGLAATMMVVLWQVQMLEQKQLKRSKAVADSANQAKSEFLANMSHELRTPLNGILGYAQILQNSKNLTAKERRGAGIIEQCGSHLLLLINDILDLSKIEARKLDLFVSEFHFPAFLQSVAEICRIRAEQKGIGFIDRLDINLPTGVKADEKRLRQVLINLLGNAIKFTDAGQVTFKVEVLDRSASEDQQANSSVHYSVHYRIRFLVQDTGVGMSPEQMAKIFLPFEQVGDSQKQVEGTGLGLTISQKIVTLMGSQIEVKSEVGRGSTFWFDVVLPESQEWAVAAGTVKQGRITGYEGEQRTVLVVDDRWENRSLIMSLLEPLGFAVIEANHGQEGWEKAIDGQPDVIITDLMMPVMDGYQLLQQIRDSETLQDIVTVASSASVFESNQQEAIDAGADVFLAKPVQADLLLQILQQRLHLNWIYDRQEEADATRNTDVALEAIVLPDQEVLEQLLAFVHDGDTQGILELGEQIIATDAMLAPFVHEVTHLVHGFQIKRLQSLVEQYLGY